MEISIILADFFVSKKIINEEDRIACMKGAEVLIDFLLNAFILMSLGIFLKDIVGVMFYIFCYVTIREYSGGFHAKSKWCCTLLTLASYLVVYLITRMTLFNMPLLIILNLIADLIFIREVPMDSITKKVLEEKKKRNRRIAIINFNMWFWFACLVLDFNPILGKQIIVTELIVVIFILLRKGEQRYEKIFKKI